MAASHPKRGSLRVQSWIYEVLNPLIESIEIELRFLERRDTTWRFYSRELEHFRPASRYLSLEGRHILNDYMSEQPELRERILAHDELVQDLADAASLAFDELTVKAAEFKGVVSDALDHFLAGGVPRNPDDISTHPRYPGGAFPPEKIPDLVAEHVVNSVDMIPPQRTDRKFWELYRDRFRALATGDAFGRLQARLDALTTFDSEFRDWLANARLELCRKYDVPAAPLSRAAAASE